MNPEEEKELNSIKYNSYKEIKRLKTQLVRVGNYLGSLQNELWKEMKLYHDADRAIADWKKLTKVTASSKPIDPIELILQDPIKAAKLFEMLKVKHNEETINSLKDSVLD